MATSPARARDLVIIYRFVFFCFAGLFILSFFMDRSLPEAVVATVLQLVVLGGLFFWAFTARGGHHLAEQPQGMPKTWRGRFLYVGLTAVLVVVMIANDFAFGDDSGVSTSTALAAVIVVVFVSTQVTYTLDARWSGAENAPSTPPSGETPRGQR